MKEAIVFTDLDGTLLDNKYSFDKARNALTLLKEKDIPLIICTSKTRAEIEHYKKKLKNKHPFISENGGAIFIPKKYFEIKFKYDRETKDYFVIELGTRYEILKKVLKDIGKKTDAKIIAFGDMTINDLMYDSGLNKTEAVLSKKREYDEPFKIIGRENVKKKIIKLIKKKGLNFTGGGRYYHILGNNDKGKAMNILKSIYERNTHKVIKTVALGDSLNDKEMLDSADEAFLIQKPDKSYAKISSTNLERVQGIGPEGWNKAINELFLEINEKKAQKIYDQSLEVLKKLQLSNGAILASPPNSRYPYVYPRDHSICVLALIEAGELKRAKKALNFLLKSQSKNGSFSQRLNKKGKDASYKPIQLDNTALILYAFAKYIKKTDDRSFLRCQRKRIRKAINYLISNLDDEKKLFFTPNSIHEFPPLEEGLEIWANAACYGVLKELEDVHLEIGIDLKKIKNSITKYMWGGDHFIKTIRVGDSSSVAKEVDASAYSLAYFGVFKDDNKKIKSTVKKIEKELWHSELGGICRYERHVGRNNGGYGPWPHFTLMICRHFINLGKKKEADKYLDWVLDVSYKGLLPEHIATIKDFERWVHIYRSAGIMRRDREIMLKNIRKSEMYKRGIAYSVLPLAWPHAEFIMTWRLYKKKFL
ncbi:MAG: HAD-IIB family hydrolase [archaeon]